MHAPADIDHHLVYSGCPPNLFGMRWNADDLVAGGVRVADSVNELVYECADLIRSYWIVRR